MPQNKPGKREKQISENGMGFKICAGPHPERVFKAGFKHAVINKAGDGGITRAPVQIRFYKKEIFAKFHLTLHREKNQYNTR